MGEYCTGGIRGHFSHGLWDRGVVYCLRGIIGARNGPWDSGTMGLWDHGTLGQWDFGNIELLAPCWPPLALVGYCLTLLVQNWPLLSTIGLFWSTIVPVCPFQVLLLLALLAPFWLPSAPFG